MEEQISNINIEIIDEAVVRKLEEFQLPNVRIPVMLFPRERWTLGKFSQGIRDEKGTLILPIISVIRPDITRAPEESFWGFESSELQIAKKVIGSKRGTPIFEVKTTPFPKFLTLEYEITLWTSSMEEMNYLLEQVIKSLKFKQQLILTLKQGGTLTGFINEGFMSKSNFDDYTNEKRIIKNSFNLRVPALLIDSKKTNTYYSVTDIKFINEIKSKPNF